MPRGTQATAPESGLFPPILSRQVRDAPPGRRNVRYYFHPLDWEKSRRGEERMNQREQAQGRQPPEEEGDGGCTPGRRETVTEFVKTPGSQGALESASPRRPKTRWDPAVTFRPTDEGCPYGGRSDTAPITDQSLPNRHHAGTYLQRLYLHLAPLDGAPGVLKRKRPFGELAVPDVDGDDPVEYDSQFRSLGRDQECVPLAAGFMDDG